MTFWQSSSFKALQAEWYAKLQEEGFEDAEANEELKKVSDQCYQGISNDQRKAKEDYFLLLSSYVESEPFDCELDRLILTLYANGASKTQIATELRQLPPRRPPSFISELYRSRKTVWYRICVYEMRWGLRPVSRKYLDGYSQPGNRHKKVG